MAKVRMWSRLRPIGSGTGSNKAIITRFHIVVLFCHFVMKALKGVYSGNMISINRVAQYFIKRHLQWPAAGVLLLGCSHLYAAGELYRYVNDKGVQVINDKVPPAVIPKGYDIISRDGVLIKRIPRQLSEEELQLRNTEESRARLREEEEARMRAWDESLMLKYSDIDDIEAAKLRAVRDLQLRISILKSNLGTIKSQIEREQKKAADIERRGADVPEAMVKNIDIMRLEVEDTEQSLAMRREEVNSVKASFQRDIERFTTLLDRVKMRRQSRQISTD